MNRRGWNLIGWTMLALGLPLSLVAVSLPSNEYQAVLGIDALDCDGPLKVLIVGIPALLLCGASLAINGLLWRSRVNLLVAVISLALCALVATSVGRAIAAGREQTAACASR